MKTYVATATREGQWWVVDVAGIGVTQGRNLAEAKVMAGDLIETMTEESPPAFEVDLHVSLDDTILSGIRDAKSAVESLTAHQLATAQLSRKAARDLVHGAGLSGRDAAFILGVSPQRVSQLLAD